jgi:SAM-dependent methyltransferase
MTNRKTHWDKVYTDKSPLELSWYQSEPAVSLMLIHNVGLGKDAPIIDVGGGASILVDRLSKEGFKHLTVLDISGKALAYAKRRLGDKAQEVEWYETDITEFIAPHAFMLWHDRAVFHFLTDPADREKYVEVLKRTLTPGGHLIIAAFAIGGPTKCSGLDIVRYDSDKLGVELAEEFLLVEQTQEKHITPTGREQKFGYFRFIRQGRNGRT